MTVFTVYKMNNKDGKEGEYYGAFRSGKKVKPQNCTIIATYKLPSIRSMDEQFEILHNLAKRMAKLYGFEFTKVYRYDN